MKKISPKRIHSNKSCDNRQETDNNRINLSSPIISLHFPQCPRTCNPDSSSSSHKQHCATLFARAHLRLCAFSCANYITLRVCKAGLGTPDDGDKDAPEKPAPRSIIDIASLPRDAFLAIGGTHRKPAFFAYTKTKS